MKKLLAVLTVVGVFALIPAAALASKGSPGDDHFIAQSFCVAGANVTTPATMVGSLLAIGYTVAAEHGGGYWETAHHIPWFGTPSDWQIDHFGLSFVTVTKGACPLPAAAPAPDPARIAYCSVAGNTLPDGTPIAPGTFLNLLAGQSATDAHYTGATPAFWVEGVGLTCSLNPSQAALASASTTLVGGGGTPFPSGLGGIYTFIPSK
jgi:hypothetical protein